MRESQRSRTASDIQSRNAEAFAHRHSICGPSGWSGFSKAGVVVFVMDSISIRNEQMGRHVQQHDDLARR